jgi:hypothetical protein
VRHRTAYRQPAIAIRRAEDCARNTATRIAAQSRYRNLAASTKSDVPLKICRWPANAECNAGVRVLNAMGGASHFAARLASYSGACATCPHPEFEAMIFRQLFDATSSTYT